MWEFEKSLKKKKKIFKKKVFYFISEDICFISFLQQTHLYLMEET